MCHPGKKLLFMGQDFAQYSEWSEERSLEWDLLQYPDHSQMQNYVKALNKFYLEHPALYQLDCDPDGFTWINSISADENMLVFTRNTKKREEMLLVVCNFSPLVYENHKIGVPYPGKYKEIFNSDRVEFGGTGAVNPRLKQSKKDECDDRPDSIKVKVPPMGISVFSYTKSEPKAKDNKSAKAEDAAKKATKKPAARKTSGKKKPLKEKLEEEYEKARSEE
jgi:1,4-alpha-glucan branching enzyme